MKKCDKCKKEKDCSRWLSQKGSRDGIIVEAIICDDCLNKIPYFITVDNIKIPALRPY